MLESKIHCQQLTLNKEYQYELSVMGATAHAYVRIFEDKKSRIAFHLKSTAEISLLNINYHFEAMSCWEKQEDHLLFDSYEEKDFSKNIKKKWEIFPEGFNFVENKQGLFLEREIAYFGDEPLQSIYDPVAAVIQLLVSPLEKSETREICIFGKQRAIKILAEKKEDKIFFEHKSGMSGLWPTLVQTLQIEPEGQYIKKAKVSSPLGVGHLVLALKQQKDLSQKEIQEIQEQFNL